MKGFKDRLIEAMKEDRISRYKLSKACGISPSTITNWLTGLTAPDKSKIAVVSKYLGVNEKWLLTGEGNKFEPEYYEHEKPLKCVGFFDLIGKDNIVEEAQSVSEKSQEYVSFFELNKKDNIVEEAQSIDKNPQEHIKSLDSKTYNILEGGQSISEKPQMNKKTKSFFSYGLRPKSFITTVDNSTVEATAVSRRFIEVVDYIKDNIRGQDNTKQSYATIAESIGVPVSLINKVKEGKANVTFSSIKKLCSVYQVSRDWLEDGIGQPFPTNFEQEGAPMQTDVDTDGLKPHFEASAAFCGMPGGFAVAIEEYQCRKYSIPNLTGHDFTLIASGRSMINRDVPEKSIFNNDVVACKIWKSRSYLRWGEVYVLATQDGIIIKKVMLSEKGEEFIKCVSFNVEEGFMPFDLPLEEIQDWAIVIGVAHINKWS